MHNPDLPDLGAINRAKASENGGANLAAIDKKYVVELCTADGGRHLKTFDLARTARSTSARCGTSIRRSRASTPSVPRS